ncbi:hypothetical protein JHW43_002486 [Diplocarpon mali]|nr:hypothetical protein JHW43_002486 [Diplocarpon mali]
MLDYLVLGEKVGGSLTSPSRPLALSPSRPLAHLALPFGLESYPVAPQSIPLPPPEPFLPRCCVDVGSLLHEDPEDRRCHVSPDHPHRITLTGSPSPAHPHRLTLTGANWRPPHPDRERDHLVESPPAPQVSTRRLGACQSSRPDDLDTGFWTPPSSVFFPTARPSRKRSATITVNRPSLQTFLTRTPSSFQLLHMLAIPDQIVRRPTLCAAYVCLSWGTMGTGMSAPPPFSHLTPSHGLARASSLALLPSVWRTRAIVRRATCWWHVDWMAPSMDRLTPPLATAGPTQGRIWQLAPDQSCPGLDDRAHRLPLQPSITFRIARKGPQARRGNASGAMLSVVVPSIVISKSKHIHPSPSTPDAKHVVRPDTGQPTTAPATLLASFG